MARWIAVLLSAALLLAGCSSDRDKGKNKDRDMPRPADRARQPAADLADNLALLSPPRKRTDPSRPTDTTGATMNTPWSSAWMPVRLV
jgi:hypothetical protein